MSFGFAKGRPMPERAALHPLGHGTDGLARTVLLAIPWIVLASMAFAFARHGVDLPLIDDWRDFMDATAGSLAPADLFRPANDTLYATGKLLDALAVRFLAYNGVVYQLLTMILCLGGLLWLVGSLLRRTMPPLAAAFGFVATIFMLQPYSYWGLQNLAYHQILPLLALLLSFRLLEAPRVSNRLLGLCAAALGTLGGLAYISGAILAASAAGTVLLLSTRAVPAAARHLRALGLGLAVAAVLTLPAQLRVILVVQDGQTHSPDIPWTMPWDPGFWAYLFGLLGRAVGAQALPPPMALALTALLLAAILATAVSALRSVLVPGRSREEMRLPTVYLTLLVAVGLYAATVAAGRASHGALPEASLYDWFRRAGDRFHYFWITLLVPFALAHLAAKTPLASKPAVAIVLALPVLALAASVGALSHGTSFSAWAKDRAADARCIQEKILAEQPIVCGTIMPYDLTQAVPYARSLDVSFTRHLLFPQDLTVEGGGVLRGETALGVPRIARVEGARVEETDRGVALAEAGADPQLHLVLPEGTQGALAACRVLRVKGTVTAAQDDDVQIFAATPDSPDYGEALSDFARYDGGGPQAFDLTVGTPRGGFLPAIRLDPGQRNGAFRIEDLSASCR